MLILTGHKTKTIEWFYLLTAAFLAMGFYVFLKKESLLFFALPVVIVISYYYVVSLDKVLLFITFATPLAVTADNSSLGAALSVPTEPLMFGVVLIFVMNLLLGEPYNRKISHHPLSYIIYFALFWMLITSFTSELPLVSFKHLLSRIWFVVPFYFVAATLFRQKKYMHWFFGTYMFGLAIVIIYTLIRHAGYGFDEDAGHWVMTPFYNDHTAYGAALAMFLPVMAGYVFYPGLKLSKRLLAVAVVALLVVAIVLSYSRAAWLSVTVSFLVLILVLLRIRFRWVLLSLLLALGIMFAFQNQIFDKLSKNKQDSSNNMMAHVESMSNISSDASNLERINRWASAIRLFEQRPWLGWGPGTYQFVYAPYQHSNEKTVISTNTGNRGNAHSEYLEPLSEQGILGLLGVLFLFGFAVYTGLKLYRKGDRYVKILSLMTTLGLITYFTHGFLNDFLNTDKLSVPVWGFMAILVALETYHMKTETGDKA